MKVVISTRREKRQLNPFNFKEEMWSDNKTVQQLDLGKKDSTDQCRLKKALYIIDGTEKPELYCKFMQRFEYNVLRWKEIKF